jgi:hypothetical protein
VTTTQLTKYISTHGERQAGLQKRQGPKGMQSSWQEQAAPWIPPPQVDSRAVPCNTPQCEGFWEACPGMQGYRRVVKEDRRHTEQHLVMWRQQAGTTIHAALG